MSITIIVSIVNHQAECVHGFHDRQKVQISSQHMAQLQEAPPANKQANKTNEQTIIIIEDRVH